MAEFDVLRTMTEKQRNKRIRDRVVDMYRQFVSEVDPKIVLDLLFEKRVINIHQKQEITNKATVTDRCRALLDHLFCCSNNESFIVLREALEDPYPWIVQRIDRCETEDEAEITLDAKCTQCKMTKAGYQEHPEDPVHVNLQYDVEKRNKKVAESMKCHFEIESENLEQKLEDCRKDIEKIKEQLQKTRSETADIKEQYEESRKATAEIKEQYEESRKATADIKEQYRILKEDFDKALLRELNLEKELYEIKSLAKSEIGDKRISETAQEALNTTCKGNEPQQNPSTSSSESTKEVNVCAVVIANCETANRITLNQLDDVTAIEPLPDTVQLGMGPVPAAVYGNSIFVCGLGSYYADIWKLDGSSSKWSKCVSMIPGRYGHSVAFVDHVLYICGGLPAISNPKELDDVETYDVSDIFDERLYKVGKLVYAIQSSCNCVQFQSSLYIFGGRMQGQASSAAQVYDTKLNTCSSLKTLMPRSCAGLHGELWGNSVILLGQDGCFIYDIDTQSWEVRDRFKLENLYSGVIVNDGKLFVIGWGAKNDDIRWIPVENFLNDEPTKWRHYAKLPNNYFAKTFVLAKLE